MTYFPHTISQNFLRPTPLGTPLHIAHPSYTLTSRPIHPTTRYTPAQNILVQHHSSPTHCSPPYSSLTALHYILLTALHYKHIALPHTHHLPHYTTHCSPPTLRLLPYTIHCSPPYTSLTALHYTLLPPIRRLLPYTTILHIALHPTHRLSPYTTHRSTPYTLQWFFFIVHPLGALDVCLTPWVTNIRMNCLQTDLLNANIICPEL